MYDSTLTQPQRLVLEIFFALPESDGFVLAGGEDLLVDLAIDSPPLGSPTITAFGPTYPPEELAARKVLALFDRAEARDFVDVLKLSEHFDLDGMLTLVGDINEGFTTPLLADSWALRLQRYDR